MTVNYLPDNFPENIDVRIRISKFERIIFELINFMYQR